MQMLGCDPEPLHAAPAPQSASALQSFEQKSPKSPLV
jgi:hypothetical protein